ncbi:hypothetical protein B0H15DRAFT_228729 [Mycena belliarum]|uniref:Uncharacterized protein n=1 Tax=Mycena belliarum TaxID=1033014 RepID=A0AAD6U7Q1_9AGAR|nr:hypothetical protein B0H15DRAFT_228729 [Mycena belliae]
MNPTRSSNTLLSEYSALFRSGLFSPSSSCASSLNESESDLGPRRGSLPTDLSPAYDSADDISMFYFTLQPKRDKRELRSFLSLDLAESQSLRSHSIKRRPSTAHSSEPPFAVNFQIPDSPCLLPPSSPLSLRRSRASSPRALPSPKPAPVSTLPSVPSQPSTPRSPAFEVAVSRTPTPLVIQRKPSLASRASATTSTVSTRYRRTRRNKALACLEGRRPAPTPLSPSENFISMSEDEDEDEDEDAPRPHTPEDTLDSSLSEDQLLMLIAGLDDGDFHRAPPSSAMFPHPPSTPVSSHTQPRRRGKTSLTLKSFMDFHDEPSHLSWRSYVEITT